MFTVGIVITFNILILNLIIAILSNTYNQFDTKSSGLYLSKILNARDDMTFDAHYGAFLLTMAPLNAVVLPFVPFALFRKPTEKLNSFVTLLQYTIFILAILIIFLVGNVFLTPFAFLKSVYVKSKGVVNQPTVVKQLIKLAMFFCYLVIGLPFMVMNLVTDTYYFTVNNFRSNLKKIIIERKKSTLTNLSIRNIRDYSNKYISLKIKSVYTNEACLSFRQNYSVLESLQYMIFGQHLGSGMTAFLGLIDKASGGQTQLNVKKLKTQNMKQVSEQKKTKLMAEDTVKDARYKIDQYNMVKNVLLNFSFTNKGQKTLCMDVIESVMDELRRERKIRMVLADDEIEQYIKLDLTSIDFEDPDLDPYIKQIVIDKKIFKEQLCQRVSIIRLGYIFEVLKMIFPGKAQMLGADFFEVKQMKTQNKEKRRRD
jgi:hypothetical protein